jgi:CheY-like chemotaxis protein
MPSDEEIGRMYTILLIEDNPNNARLMCRVLERHNFTVLHAEDGENGPADGFCPPARSDFA